MCMQSCLFEQKDIFEDSASVRLQKAVKTAQSVLVSSEDGWLFEMFPEPSQGYGGYSAILKFTQTDVTVVSELYDKAETTYYKMIYDNGPVIIFDTYNTHIHFFSDPSPTLYQSYQGEFEYVIVKTENDLITLRGSRTGNKVYLRRFTGDAQQYLEGISQTESLFIMTGATGQVGTENVTWTVDTDYRQLEYTDSEGNSQSAAYALTDKGIRLYAPIEVGGLKLQNFEVAEGGSKLNCIDDGASSVSLKAVFPEGFRPYSAYEGRYTLLWGNSAQYNCEVQLVPAGDGASYLMKGLNSNYDVVLTYSKGKGTLLWATQMLTKDGEFVKCDDTHYVGCTAWDAAKGYINYGSTIGIVTKWNGDETNPVYAFVDNGAWGTYTVSSFYFYKFKGTTQSSSTRDGSINGFNDYYPAGTGYNMSYIRSLTKIN